MLTLTYDRNEYADARECYRAQQEEQHIPLFFRRLARALGVDLAGRWFCKVEFQQAGWVHFHCVVVGVSWIDHEVLTETWGHGHTWVKPATRSKLAYACKYVAKDGGVPDWLLDERRVRIVRVSSGFWGGETRQRERKEPPEFRYTFAYIPIGVRLERARGEVVVREEVVVSSYKPGVQYTGRVVRHRQLRITIGELGWRLLCAGLSLTEGSQRGWLAVDLSLEEVEKVATRAATAARAPLPLKEGWKDDAGAGDDQWAWWWRYVYWAIKAELKYQEDADREYAERNAA